MVKVLKVVSLVIFLCFIFLVVYFTQDAQFKTYESTYLYDNQELLTVSSEDEKEQVIDDLASEKTNLIASKTVSVVNINEQDYSLEDIKKQASIELVHGYKYTIDDAHTITVSDKDIMDKAYDNVLALYLSDAAFQAYKTTGKIPEFSKDGKEYSEFYVSSKFSVEEGNYAQNEVYDNINDVQYFLLNGEAAPKYEYISEDQTFNDIINEHELDPQLVNLNNPQVSDDSLMYIGQEVVINEPSPVFNMVAYYESTDTREIPFQDFEKPSEDLYTGETEVEQEGSNGQEELVYRNKVINGEIVEQSLLSNRVVVQPENKITLVGTKTYYSPSTGGSTSSGDSSGSNFSGDGGFEFQDGTGDFAWPAVCHTVTNGYYGYAGHDAIDIQCGYGSPVYAADNGTVIDSGFSAYGYGNYVKIDHGNGYQTLYGHMAQPANVSAGASVYRGQVIGYEGNTGNSTGHHLHFEIRYHDSKPYLNPLTFY